MIFPNQIFVLSYFPGPKITAWSRFILPFTADYAVSCGGQSSSVPAMRSTPMAARTATPTTRPSAKSGSLSRHESPATTRCSRRST